VIKSSSSWVKEVPVVDVYGQAKLAAWMLMGLAETRRMWDDWRIARSWVSTARFVLPVLPR
jgi:hypothetical protein